MPHDPVRQAEQDRPRHDHQPGDRKERQEEGQDGVRVHEGILEAGETRKWEGVRSVALRAGNGAGVTVKLNGELLGPLGEKDEVIDIEWVYEGPVEIENPSGSGDVAAGQSTPESIAGNPETPAAPEDLPG